MTMKKLFLILLSMGLIFGASAQKFRGGGTYVKPRVVAPVRVYSPYYAPFYAPYRYAYSPFAFGYGFGYGYPYGSP